MARLVTPTGKERTLPPAHPNVGLQAEYRRRLNVLIDELNKSILYWLSANYKKTAPLLASDELPAIVMRREMARLSKQWRFNFAKMAPELAKWFAQKSKDYNDDALKNILKRGGMSVNFKMTPAMQNAQNAKIAENVGLITNIADEHLTRIEGAVMRSVQEGRDLGSLAKTLREQFDIPKKRAALIARDQNNKATAINTRVRQAELGITRARWIHSSAGRKPRVDHVAFSKGRYTGGTNPGPYYNVDDGAVLDEGKCWPGTLINCRCISRSVIEGLDDDY